MRLLKILFTLLTSTLLTGCVTANDPAWHTVDVSTTDYVEVQNITTPEPDVRTTINDSCMLRYTIYPYNATDKSIRVDTMGADDIISIIIDDYNSVFVWGKSRGNCTIRLIASNGKSVEFDVTVIDPEHSSDPNPDTDLSTVDRIAKHFNEAAADYGITIYYYLDLECWWLKRNFGPCSTPTQQTLGEAVYFFRPFLPDYLFRYDEKYDGTEYRLVMVNSNISAAVEIYSYVEDGNLFAEVVIFSVW